MEVLQYRKENHYNKHNIKLEFINKKPDFQQKRLFYKKINKKIDTSTFKIAQPSRKFGAWLAFG